LPKLHTDHQRAAILIVPREHCEQLYQTRATHYQDLALGTFSCLPRSDRVHPADLVSWNAEREPWLLDQTLDGQQLRCLLWVDPQLEYFTGHFPSQPILPGVVQLEWSLKLAAQQWPAAMHETNFNGAQNLKFKSPVEPAELLQLVLSQQPGKIDFRFSTPTEVRSQGTLLYRV
jgi:3-hydroxymyristoyl/3-hydroxydecanoyl-(acyl carrier protein) dehydratase